MNDSHRAEALRSIARWVVDQGAAPAAVVSAAWREGNAWRIECGAAGRRSAQCPGPVSTDSVFDLASITKPLVSVTATAEAARQRIPLSTPVGNLHPTLAHTPLARVPFELLLAHRAGLRPHLELFDPVRSGVAFDRRDALEQAAAAVFGDIGASPPSEGHAPVYSDLGYLIVGEILEHLTQRPLDDLVDEHVVEPLELDIGSMRWWLRKTRNVLGRVVPTEHVLWRGGEILGQTHDENAWAWAGHGTAGHAGLFGTAGAICKFGCAVLDARRHRGRAWMSGDLLAPLLAPRPGGTLRAGFDGKSPQGSSGGELCSGETIGHLGFTGTSFWCDPAADAVTVLLTNRVSPNRDRFSLREVRPKVHDALFAFSQSTGEKSTYQPT